MSDSIDVRQLERLLRALADWRKPGSRLGAAAEIAI
jgi:hypothetical protein